MRSHAQSGLSAHSAHSARSAAHSVHSVPNDAVEEGAPLLEPVLQTHPTTPHAPRTSRLFQLLQWVFFFLLGLGPWLIVNGAFVEVPILKSRVPEGNSIGSMLGAATQVGNVAIPVVIALRRWRVLSVNSSIFVFLVVASANCLLLAVFWESVVDVPFGIGRHSVPLLALAFAGGLVGCASKVTHFPFAAKYGNPAFISAVSTGMGVSGLFPVCLGYLQGAAGTGDEKVITHTHFPVTDFMLVVFAVLSVSLASFLVFMAFETTCAGAWKERAVRVNDDDDDERVGGTVVGSEDGRPEAEAEAVAATEREGARGRLAFFWRNKRPLLNQAVGSFLNYAVYPGMLTYLRVESSSVFWFTALYYAANLVGRWFPTIRHVYQLEAINVCQCALYLFFVWGATQSTHDLPFALFAPAVFVFSFLNGLTCTMVAQFIRKFTPVDDQEPVYQAMGVSGQIGSFGGTYFTLALALLHAFRIK